MEKEINGKNDYKNDETNQSIVANNYTSGIYDFDGFDFKSIHSINLEEDSISFSGKDDSKSLEFPYFEVLNDDDEINEKLLNFLKNRYTISSPSKTSQQIKFKVLRIKRGRKEKKDILSRNKKEKIHNKYGKDNIIRKCQISYFDFIIHFINIIINLFNVKKSLKTNNEFIKLDYNFKRVVNGKQKIKLLTYTIEDMIKSNNISRKYSKSNLSSNKDLYKEIKKLGIPEIEKIFKKKFIFLFDIYHKSIRKFNLKELDENLANLTIEIPEKVKLYKDILRKNKNDRKFEELMEKNIKNYFECSKYFSIKFKQ